MLARRSIGSSFATKHGIQAFVSLDPWQLQILAGFRGAELTSVDALRICYASAEDYG